MNIYIVDGAPSVGVTKKIERDMGNQEYSGTTFVPGFANVCVRNEELFTYDPSLLIEMSASQMAARILAYDGGKDGDIIFDGSPISYLTYFQHHGVNIEKSTHRKLNMVINGIRNNSRVILLRPLSSRFIPPRNLKIVHPDDFFGFDARLTDNYLSYFGSAAVEMHGVRN